MGDQLERRRNVRITPDPGMPVILYLGKDEGSTFRMDVVDISQFGAGCISDKNLDINSVYSVTVILPDPKNIVLCDCKIKYKGNASDKHRYGLEFKLESCDQSQILSYIRKNIIRA